MKFFFKMGHAKLGELRRLILVSPQGWQRRRRWDAIGSGAKNKIKEYPDKYSIMANKYHGHVDEYERQYICDGNSKVHMCAINP